MYSISSHNCLIQDRYDQHEDLCDEIYETICANLESIREGILKVTAQERKQLHILLDLYLDACESIQS